MRDHKSGDQLNRIIEKYICLLLAGCHQNLPLMDGRALVHGHTHKMAKLVCLFNQIQHNILCLQQTKPHEFVVFG